MTEYLIGIAIGLLIAVIIEKIQNIIDEITIKRALVEILEDKIREEKEKEEVEIL